MRNILIDGLTKEEEARLREFQLDRAIREGREKGREEGKFESVERLVVSGMADPERACEVLGVDPDAYRKWASKSK